MATVESVYRLVEQGLETLVEAAQTNDPKRSAIVRVRAYEILEQAHKLREQLARRG
jgi:hypothetical protein